MPTPRLIVVDVTEDDRANLFSRVNDVLVQEAMVGPNFLSAVSAREDTYPTGLDFGYVCIAIPHIDVEHVRAPGVLVCRNSHTTHFRAMDDPERSLDVQVSIWPLVTDPHNQVGMLSALIGLVQDRESYKVLRDGSQQELAERLSTVLTAVADDDGTRPTSIVEP